jgi:hypothetical protein
MMDAKSREAAESAFNRYERREAEISRALQQEHARHEAALKNMYRLRLLRLQRDAENAASEVAIAGSFRDVSEEDCSVSDCPTKK